MQWNWQVIIDSIPQLLEGTLITVKLVASSGLLGLLFGILIALAGLQKSWFIKAIPMAFIFFFRGTPLLVQIFLVYYGLAQFEFVKNSWLWEPVLSEAYWCAIIAFTLNTSAYIAEIVRGAIQSIPAGELEAADAIGLSPTRKFIRIVLPRAFGIMIPAYSNEVIFMLKGSALASTITIMELTASAGKISSKTYSVFELYFAAGVIYLLLSWIFLLFFRFLEKQFNKHHSYVPPEVMAGTVSTRSLDVTS